MRSLHTTRTAKIKKTNNTKWHEDVNQPEFSYTDRKSIKRYNYFVKLFGSVL